MTRNIFAPRNDCLEESAFAGPSKRRLLVIDESIHRFYGERLDQYLCDRGLHATTIRVRSDEAGKVTRLALGLAERFDDFGLDRRSEPIIGIGGGVLLDVVGFVASLYRRGTPYVRIPTSLVGLVDAGVGVKTGVNHNGHKNRLGTYHAPTQVLLDPEFLRTLPKRHLSNGLGEIAKMALVCDARLWDLLAAEPERVVTSALGTLDERLRPQGDEIIRRAVHGMLAELHDNLWEVNLARLVDFGHTFSPIFEMRATPPLLHGEAVAIDMALCAVISNRRGALSDAHLEQVLMTFQRLGLPTWNSVCTAAVAALGLDDITRHRGGMQRVPLPLAPGTAFFVNDITIGELQSTCQQLFTRSACEDG